jgi:hypothetical protein
LGRSTTLGSVPRQVTAHDVVAIGPLSLEHARQQVGKLGGGGRSTYFQIDNSAVVFDPRITNSTLYR